jgi:hypothetical protein
MIGEAEAFEIGNLRAPFTLESVAMRGSTEPAANIDVSTAEQEITRLTWSVLDGSASLSDRQRLAELVKAQHAVRRRIDR